MSLHYDYWHHAMVHVMRERGINQREAAEIMDISLNHFNAVYNRRVIDKKTGREARVKESNREKFALALGFNSLDEFVEAGRKWMAEDFPQKAENSDEPEQDHHYATFYIDHEAPHDADSPAFTENAQTRVAPRVREFISPTVNYKLMDDNEFISAIYKRGSEATERYYLIADEVGRRQKVQRQALEKIKQLQRQLTEEKENSEALSRYRALFGVIDKSITIFDQHRNLVDQNNHYNYFSGADPSQLQSLDSLSLYLKEHVYTDESFARAYHHVTVTFIEKVVQKYWIETRDDRQFHCESFPIFHQAKFAGVIVTMVEVDPPF